MEERKMSEKEAMELIARSLEAQRRKLSFVRSTLFFGGALALAVTTADYVVRRTTGRDLTLLLVLAGTVAGLAALYFHYRSHRTVTANDRTLMNVWAYALGVCLYTAGYVATGDGLQLPVMGLLTMGAAIAAGVTGELFEPERIAGRTALHQHFGGISRRMDLPGRSSRRDRLPIHTHPCGSRHPLLRNGNRAALQRTPEPCLKNSTPCCIPNCVWP